MNYAVLSNLIFVTKFTIKNLNKDFINAVRGGGDPRLMKEFHKFPVFFERWLPLGRVTFSKGTFNVSANNVAFAKVYYPPLLHLSGSSANIEFCDQ